MGLLCDSKPGMLPYFNLSARAPSIFRLLSFLFGSAFFFVIMFRTFLGGVPSTFLLDLFLAAPLLPPAP
jgi:hypothetical protein